MNLVYFVLLISVLIFIHELGHFATAKTFGIKVLVFSIGFGPRLIRIRGKETEYCIGILPLGGFVRMLEESKNTGPIRPEDKKRTFEAQALWKRVIVVLAGPAMNLLFPIALYTSVFLDDKELLPAVVGSVMPGKPADGHLQVGDRILTVEGTSVTTLPEVQEIVSRRSDLPTTFVVEREGKTETIVMTPLDAGSSPEETEIGITTHNGHVGFQTSFAAPVVGVPRTNSPAYRAGLRTFDRITALNGRPVERLGDLQRTLSSNRGDSVVLAYMRPIPQPNAAGGLCDLAVMEPGVATLTPSSASADLPPQDASSRANDVFERTGIESSDMYTAYVPEGSSEWKAGLRRGDRILGLDGQPTLSWFQLGDALKREPQKIRALTWTRDGEPMAGSFGLREEAWDDEYGQTHEKFVFRTTHWMPSAPDQLVKNPHLWTYALRHGFQETGRAVQTISVLFVRVFQGKMSLKSVGGPITVYEIAGEAGAKGASYFVWVMALLSVNLGLINLLPLPVLDGGHLLFFLIEAARGKPIARRTREIASLVGLSMMIVLMAIAFKNDVQRSELLPQVKELWP